MTDIASRIDRLRAESAAKREAEQSAARDRRALAWSRIKAEKPEMAEWLTLMNAVFGRPERLWSKIEGERVL